MDGQAIKSTLGKNIKIFRARQKFLNGIYEPLPKTANLRLGLVLEEALEGVAPCQSATLLDTFHF
jgi:hypothetical protein